MYHTKKILLLCLLITSLATRTSSEQVLKTMCYNAIIGITGITLVTTFLYQLGKLINVTFFSAKAYYHSAKKLYKNSIIPNIENITSFDDLLLILKQYHGQWETILLSDCYLVDIYHFLKEYIQNCIQAKKYVSIALRKTDANEHETLCSKIRTLLVKINTTQDHLLKARSLCESHSLFKTHLKIYQEKERQRLQREKMLQSSLHTASMLHEIRAERTKKHLPATLVYVWH